MRSTTLLAACVAALWLACLLPGCAGSRAVTGEDSTPNNAEAKEATATLAPDEPSQVAPDQAGPRGKDPTVTGSDSKSAPKQRPVPSAGVVKAALDKACNWLTSQQLADGAYGYQLPDGAVADVGITAMVIQSLATSPRAYREADGPFISAAIKYLHANQQENGGFYNDGQGLRNYKTSVTILALTELDSKRKKKLYVMDVARAREYVTSLQCAEDSTVAYDKDEHRAAYGGIGYGSDRRPDLSNTQFALEALQAAGLAEDSDIYVRARVFLERCQNSEGNDLFDSDEIGSTGDGGFMYSPGSTKAGEVSLGDGVTGFSSYGSMTYAGLKSYIYAGLTRDDARVVAAWKWIQKNYTVEHNAGMATDKDPKRGWMGLYYYYLVMARTLEVLEVDTVPTPDGKEHRWAQELAAKLLELQSPKGSWVNPVDRWWEGSDVLTTAYAIQALSACYENLKD